MKQKRNLVKIEVDSDQQINEVYVNRFLRKYQIMKEKINSRLSDFDSIDKSDKNKLYEELAFCFLTPQSKAKSADLAIKSLIENKILFSGSAEEIQPHLRGIRFHITKSKRLEASREVFDNFNFNFDNIFLLRDEIVNSFKGIGMKEASHFLRNIGYGSDIAILDRHILKNLKHVGVIEEVPATISRKKYIEIEDKMKDFCNNIGISMAELDLLLWSEETGEIIK
jgi:N-glycosylase/DNA lyase